MLLSRDHDPSFEFPSMRTRSSETSGSAELEIASGSHHFKAVRTMKTDHSQKIRLPSENILKLKGNDTDERREFKLCFEFGHLPPHFMIFLFV